jgi:hypothetical protein
MLVYSEHQRALLLEYDRRRLDLNCQKSFCEP